MKRRKSRKPPVTAEGFQIIRFISNDKLSQTIAEIRNWPPYSEMAKFGFATPLAQELYEISYNVKLANLSGEQIARMLIQTWEADLIIPLALEAVGRNLQAEGYWPGHLTELLLKTPVRVWQKHPKLLKETVRFVNENKPEMRAKRLNLKILDLKIDAEE